MGQPSDKAGWGLLGTDGYFRVTAAREVDCVGNYRRN